MQIKKIVFATIIISSIQFGLLHLFNLFVTDSNLYFVLGQVIFASLLGLFYGYIRYKSNSIIFPIIAHMIINFIPVINYFY